jgi:tetratricopeptide (TPR) repeat protein
MNPSQRTRCSSRHAPEFLRYLGRSQEAILWKEQALKEARELSLDGLTAATLHDLADIHVQLGDLKQARELSHEAVAIREKHGDPEEIAHALSSLPDVALLEGNLDEALALCERLDSLLPDDDGEQARFLELTRAEVYRPPI